MNAGLGRRVLRIVSIGAIAALLALELAGLVLFLTRAATDRAILEDDGVAVGTNVAAWGVPVSAYLWLRVLLELLLVAVSVVAGLLVLTRRAPDFFGCAVAVVLVAAPISTGVGAVALSVVLAGDTRAQTQLGFLAIATYLMLAQVFPNGRFVRRWSRWAVLGWLALAAWALIRPWWEAGAIAKAVGTVTLIVLIALVAGAQIIRYRRFSTRAERQQVTWVAVALVLRVGYLIALQLVLIITAGRAGWPPRVALPAYLAMTAFSYLLAAATAVLIAVALLRYRLVDADSWLSRSLGYAALVVAVLGVYALIVGGIGLLWQPGGAILAVLATALVALILHPLRVRLLGLANRLVYGTSGQPVYSREQLVRAHEIERRRLGRDLHDGLGPTVAGLHLRVDTALALLPRDPARSAELLVAVRTELVELIAEIRRIVDDLRPSGLEEVGLAAAVARAVVAEAAGTGAGTPVIEVEPAILPPLPAEVELAAYRIAVEAVTNARRHANGATRCTVSLQADGRWLRVAVADDGPGLAPDAPAGVGLASMRERAREIGGALTVAAVPGGGTMVVATLPLGSETPRKVREE